MKKITRAVFPILLGIALIGCIPYYFFPGDVLNNIPSFSEDGWARPKNSLLADPVYQFEPWRAYSKNELVAGRFPLWNSMNGSGVPHFANSQSAVLFPLYFFYYIFPPRPALFIISILKLAVFFSFFYLYLREIGIKRAISFLGAFVAATSGFMMLWLHWPHTNVYMFLPVILWITEKFNTTTKYQNLLVVFLAIIYCSAIFGGHPETLFHVIILNVYYALFRFWGTFRKILLVILGISLGSLLGAVQLLPFLEYVLHSHILVTRSNELQEFIIPLIAFVLNFFPFISGTPQYLYYRPIAMNTNFQEAVGGYVSTISLIFLLAGYKTIRQHRLALFWTSVVIISWLLSYSIWPFSLINTIPLISISANHRLIAFAGFGAIIVFSFVLSSIVKYKQFIGGWQDRYLIKIFRLFGGVLAILLAILYFVLPLLISEHRGAAYQLSLHIILISVSSYLGIFGILLYTKRFISERILYIVLYGTLAAQSILLFWNYNPFVTEKNYYPNTPIISMLTSQPPGVVMEVGNPSLPANVNLIYNLSHIMNNDAVEIRWYRQAYDAIFREKNHWGLPNEVSVSQLRSFGVNYVLSDYDISLKRQVVQPIAEQVMRPLTTPYVISFNAAHGVLRQIRFRSATFNRSNSCMLSLRLLEAGSSTALVEKKYPCSALRNNMFTTISVSPTRLINGKKYEMHILSDAAGSENAVALWGKNGAPYTEMLYESAVANDFDLIGRTQSSYLWMVNGVDRVSSVDEYKFLHETSDSVVIEAIRAIPGDITIKKTYYPGWSAKVNGTPVTMNNANPFIRIPLEAGYNYITLSYAPRSFILGLSITVFTAILMLAYVLRRLYAMHSMPLIEAHRSLLKKKATSIPFVHHVIIVFCGLVISSFLCTVTYLIVRPSFLFPYTTAINWYTVHKYPKDQDYLYVLFAIAVVTIMTSLFWSIVVWKQKIK